MQSPDCYASELGSNTDFPCFFFFFFLFFFQLLQYFNIAKMYTPVFFPVRIMCVDIFLKVIIGHNCVARLTASFSANRMESSGCERSFGFSTSRWGVIFSLSLFLKK